MTDETLRVDGDLVDAGKQVREPDFGKWQPIETARKKHGYEILVAEIRGNRICAAAVVSWLDRSYVMDGEEENFFSGWYISDGHNDPIWYRGWERLTHWMLIPEPPK